MLSCSCLSKLQFLWYITLFQDIYSRLTKNQHVHCSSLDDWDWVPPEQFNAITKQFFIKAHPNGRLNKNDMRLVR